MSRDGAVREVTDIHIYLLSFIKIRSIFITLIFLGNGVWDFIFLDNLNRNIFLTSNLGKEHARHLDYHRMRIIIWDCWH